jgi:hypothetical protein
MISEDDFCLTVAERELIEFVRGKAGTFRSIEVAVRDTFWHIQTHADGPEPSVLIGSGSAFADAWRNRCDPRERYPVVH